MDEVLVRFRLMGDEATALKKLCALEHRKPYQMVKYLLLQELKNRELLTEDKQDKGMLADG